MFFINYMFTDNIRKINTATSDTSDDYDEEYQELRTATKSPHLQRDIRHL